MVKVISVHHFLSQDVSSIPSPTAVAMAGQNILLMATENLNVEVRDLKKAGQVTHTFPVINLVSSIVFSPIGNYVATLEGEPGEKGANVRIYSNWHNPKNESVRPRIASRVTPSLRSDQPGLDNVLDMIEFPHRDSPLQITVCPSTGNFMVAAVNVLVIYKYSLKTQEVSRTKFIDFEDCIHIFHNFIPKEITLIEDVIGCLNKTEVHVFKVKLVDANDEKNLRSLSVYSFSSESESNSFDPWTGKSLGRKNSAASDDNSTTDSTSERSFKNVTLAREEDSETSDSHHLPGYTGNVKRHQNHLFIPDALNARNKIVLPDVEKANREFASQACPKIMEQILGPKAAPPLMTGNASGQSGLEVIVKLVPTSSTSDQDTMVEAEAVTLVHCKLLKSEEDRENQFKNLKLRPVYWREFKVRKSNGKTATSAMSPMGIGPQTFSHPLQSAWHPHLMSMTMVFTSNMEGFIYHLPGHIRKSGRGLGVKRIATCPFTSAVGQITLESSTIMHAFTLTGLETYTLKTGQSTILEAEVLDHKSKTCPNGNMMPVCLVGLRPFLGVKEIVASSSYLVLLSMASSTSSSSPTEESKAKWTMYNLCLPPALALYKSMIELADLSKSLNPSGYLELISEAHVVLRTACHSLTWTMATTKSNPEIDAQLKITKEHYQGSCQLLGNHYALQATTKNEIKLALPYYRMSGYPILHILKNVMDAWIGSKKSQSDTDNTVLPPGLVYYIKTIILDPLEGEDTLEANLADMLIDTLGQYSSDTLSTLVLKSPSFRQFKSHKIFAHIKKELVKNEIKDATDVLAYVVLSVDQGSKDNHSLDEATNYLKIIQPGRLSEVILEHHEFLVEDNAGDNTLSLTDVAALLCDAVPVLFVEVLVSLIKSDVYSLQTVLHLLIGSLVSNSSLADCRANDAALLQLFLESYFMDVIDASNPADNSIILDGDQLQALHTLVRSYLTSLSVPVRFEEKNIDCNMFGSRFLYLDLLPPFKSTNVKDTMMNTDSPEFWCQNSLLKLQSLLCSNLCKGASCKSIVQGYLDIKPDTNGHMSLKILCLDDAKSSIPLLVDHHPEVLMPFAKEHNVDQGKYKFRIEIWQRITKSDKIVKVCLQSS